MAAIMPNGCCEKWCISLHWWNLLFVQQKLFHGLSGAEFIEDLYVLLKKARHLALVHWLPKNYVLSTPVYCQGLVCHHMPYYTFYIVWYYTGSCKTFRMMSSGFSFNFKTIFPDIGISIIKIVMIWAYFFYDRNSYTGKMASSFWYGVQRILFKMSRMTLWNITKKISPKKKRKKKALCILMTQYFQVDHEDSTNIMMIKLIHITQT